MTRSRDDLKTAPATRKRRAASAAVPTSRSGRLRRIPDDGLRRVVIENVRPGVDGGRFAVKRTVGESLEVRADVFADGHGRLGVVLHHRAEHETAWHEIPMQPLGNDVWSATFTLEAPGFHEYTLEAWTEPFGTWRDELVRRVEAGQDVTSELLEGAALVRSGASRAPARARARLEARAEELVGPGALEARVRLALDDDLDAQMSRIADRSNGVRHAPALRVWADRERARVGAWYEMFPRSAGTTAARPARFDEAARRLPDIAAMGFDVLYLPPIHPIGRSHRKGPNNTIPAGPDDPGSPWAIGGPEGGHTAVDPALGTLADFDRFVAQAGRHGLEVALDIAFQCSPDHPWIREHPGWFRHRPDGSIKHAENPPKKYQDIVPLDFECRDWRGLWSALLDVVTFWIGHGVRIFRVDNPHTKPFAFWDWLIGEVQREHPDVVFLSEAFTRPRVMERLAKGGFTQSYTYFTWRNTRAELTDYFTELTQTPVREYLRPNLFTNTPDILHAYLQAGGRPAFQARLVLAATLGASYGIYGPPFELCVGDAVPGTEEYVNSEKYEVRVWDLDRPGGIRDLVTLVNRARHEHPALQFDHRLRFHATDNDALLCYSKTTSDHADRLLVVVNLDPHAPQHGWVQLSLDVLGLASDESFEVHDLLGDARYRWRGARNYVRLDPAVMPAHLFIVSRGGPAARDGAAGPRTEVRA
jgi:starch synthase (maltosyl-transferring)